MQTMNVTELRDRLDAGPVALFDVRGDVEYQRGHIPGARSAPLGSLVFRVASLMNPTSLVVVYSSGDDGLATEAAERLAGLRLENVRVVDGGLAAWDAAGLPIEAVAQAKPHTDGPAVECRSVVVDRERAYGGAFRGAPVDGEGAGG